MSKLSSGKKMNNKKRRGLPIRYPRKNQSLAGTLNPIGFKELSADKQKSDLIKKVVTEYPSLIAITHAVAKAADSFSTKQNVLIVRLVKNTYKNKVQDALMLTFNYDQYFYGHLKAQGYFGVFYDKETQSTGINLSSKEAINWVNQNARHYFQIIISIDSHEVWESEYWPRYKEPFKSICNRVTPITIWLDEIIQLTKQLDKTIEKHNTQISIHNGSEFVLMPDNFFLVCRVDLLLVRVYDKKGKDRYISMNIKDKMAGHLYKHYQKKQASIMVSQYMDSCNKFKEPPYTVKDKA